MATLWITLGSSCSNNLYIASNEELLEFVVHFVSENNMVILVTYGVGRAACGGTIDFLFFLVDFDISLKSFLSGLVCSNEKEKRVKSEHLECERNKTK